MDRLAVLEKLIQHMPATCANELRSKEQKEGEDGAALELAALLTFVTAHFLKRGDDAWFKSRLRSIQHRGVRDSDAPFIKVAESNVDIAALTELIAQFQWDTAASFFLLHSGASGNPCESVPELRLLLSHGKADEEYSVGHLKKFPNWLDEYFSMYRSDVAQQIAAADRADDGAPAEQ